MWDKSPIVNRFYVDKIVSRGTIVPRRLFVKFYFLSACRSPSVMLPRVTERQLLSVTPTDRAKHRCDLVIERHHESRVAAN